MDYPASTNPTPLALSHVQKSVVEALELLHKSRTILTYSYKEPSLNRTNEEKELLGAAKEAEQAVRTLIHNLTQKIDRVSLPPQLDRLLFRRTSEQLMTELIEEPVVPEGLPWSQSR